MAGSIGYAELSVRHRGQDYQCGHYLADMWKHLTGDNLPPSMDGFLLPVTNRTALEATRSDFTKVSKPDGGPLICVFRKMKGEPHVGMLWKRKVLELTVDGPAYRPLHVAMFGFSSVRFYRPTA